MEEPLFAGNRHHFFHRGHAALDQALAVLAHGAHAGLLGGGEQAAFGGALVHQRADLVVGHHEFVDAGAALVAALAAVIAAHGVPAALVVLAAAVHAELAHQALRQYA